MNKVNWDPRGNSPDTDFFHKDKKILLTITLLLEDLVTLTLRQLGE